jgi:anti-sigma B factor antagonist
MTGPAGESSMNLQITHQSRTTTAGNATVVTVASEIDVAMANQLREGLLNVLEQGVHHTVIDITKVDFLDSTGLGVLVGVQHRLSTPDGTMTFVGASERIMELFRVTRLSTIFPVYATADQALQPSADTAGDVPVVTPPRTVPAVKATSRLL